MVLNLEFRPGTGRGTIRWMVEGSAQRRLTDDVPNSRLDIVEHQRRRNPQNGNIMRSKPAIAPCISFRAVPQIMRYAVDLNRKPYLGTEKIEHIGTSRMLAPKLETVRSGAKCAPQEAFGQAQGAPQSARFNNCSLRSRQHSVSPSTALRAVPLPVPGRNSSI